MSKRILVFVFAIAVFLGFKVSVKAAYVSFYDEENGTKIGYMEHVHEADITVADPTRAGFDFIGWSDEDGNDLGLNVTISAGSIGDRTFIANWEEIIEEAAEENVATV